MCIAVSDVNDIYAQVPGGPGRWTLAGVEGGLEAMADMYSTVNTLANDMTLYTTLQGITMQLLILRLIKVLSAQKRLSILTTTAIKVSACRLSSQHLELEDDNSSHIPHDLTSHHPDQHVHIQQPA